LNIWLLQVAVLAVMEIHPLAAVVAALVGIAPLFLANHLAAGGLRSQHTQSRRGLLLQ
jgi:hypothetical protein